jgi:SAM-dependent methyltransferase
VAFDPYAAIAELYDLSYADFDGDADFYAELAQICDGPILELGVGSGRVAVPLAKAGYRVVGIDTSRPMLARGRDYAARAGVPAGNLDLREGDMMDFDLAERFGLVFVAADTFQHLQTTAEQLACARAAARHLLPGGVFAMSIRSPASVSWDDAGYATPLLHDWTRTDPATGDQISRFVSAHPDPARMTREMTYFYDRLHDGIVQRTVFQTTLRYSTQAEIELVLQQAGLRVTHLYGDYDLSPVGAATDNLIFVARAAAK